MRPFLPSDKEREKGASFVIDSEENIIREKNGLISKSDFHFDRCYDQNNNNETIFKETAQSVVKSVMDGYNGVIFAYGQTSSGKTHTMFGNPQDEGIIPRALKELFSCLTKSRSEWLIRVSFLEIYNENLFDLFNTHPESSKLNVHEDKNGDVKVENLVEEVVYSEKHVLSLLEEGNRNRHVASTAMNERSSRSHAVFSMIIESKEITLEDIKKAKAVTTPIIPPPSLDPATKTLKKNGQVVNVSHFFLVDLAGSERASKTGATNETLKEGAHINKSLLTLSTVINKLVELKKNPKAHIPYRDSKLTRLLKIGLGNNAKLSILCCITPGCNHLAESVSTLRFGSNAKKIKNKIKKNEVGDQSALLQQYKSEIELLRAEMDRNKSEIEEKRHLRDEMQKTKEKMVEYERMITRLTDMILVGVSDEEAAMTLLKARKQGGLTSYLKLQTKSPNNTSSSSIIKPVANSPIKMSASPSVGSPTASEEKSLKFSQMSDETLDARVVESEDDDSNDNADEEEGDGEAESEGYDTDGYESQEEEEIVETTISIEEYQKLLKDRQPILQKSVKTDADDMKTLEIAKLRRELEEERHRANTAIGELEAFKSLSSKKEIEEQLAMANSILEDNKKKFEQKNKELEETRNKYEMKLAEMKKKHEEQTEFMKNKFEKEISVVQQQLADEKSYDSKIEKLVAPFASRQNELEQELAEKDSIIHRLKTENFNLKSKMQSSQFKTESDFIRKDLKLTATEAEINSLDVDDLPEELRLDQLEDSWKKKK